MRFQDAARDARAVVYAGIQADPQVAAAAELLADATPAQRVLARAVMNGETTDADGWRVMFPTLFGPAASADAAELARSAAILRRRTRTRLPFFRVVSVYAWKARRLLLLAVGPT